MTIDPPMVELEANAGRKSHKCGCRDPWESEHGIIWPAGLAGLMQRVFLATHSSKWNKGLLGEYLNKKVLTWKIDKMSFMYEFKNSITEMCWIQFLPWVKSWLICSKLFVHRHSTFFLPSSTPHLYSAPFPFRGVYMRRRILDPILNWLQLF